MKRMNRYQVIFICMAVCTVLAALTGVGAARYYAHGLHTTQVKLGHAEFRLQKTQSKELEQQRLTCIANRKLNGLIHLIVQRQKQLLKTDKGAKRKNDKLALKLFSALERSYGDATSGCKVRKVKRSKA